ncbi:MAG: hypothetical protein B7Z03_12200, partial [Hydrogenophilales bacterium 32-62-9]
MPAPQPGQPLHESCIASLPLVHTGKVRDIYAVGDDKLLIVTTDRLSAFDVVMPTPIPSKGEVLTKVSAFWFDKLKAIVPSQATKAAVGAHDENIAFEQMATLIGADLATQIRDVSLALYQAAAEYALTRGIIIADTKFEFGLDEAGQLVWIDEALTPDSSRFWPADQYQPGSNPPSFDKQFVRDWLEASGWNKQAPGPELPPEIVARTA